MCRGAPPCPPSPEYSVNTPEPAALWQPEEVPITPFSPGPSWTPFSDEEDTFSDIDVSDTEGDIGVPRFKRQRTPSPPPPKTRTLELGESVRSVKRRLDLVEGKLMAAIGANHDGTITADDAGTNDVGRNQLRERDNTPSPRNGGVLGTNLNTQNHGNGISERGGNGLEEQIFPPSLMVSEVSARLAAPNGAPYGDNASFPDSLMGRRPVFERLGPFLGTNPVHEFRGFHTPPVHTAGYGPAGYHSPDNGHTFVPTSAGTLPGPPVNFAHTDDRLHQLQEAVKGLQNQIAAFANPPQGPIRPQAQYAAPGGGPQFGPYNPPLPPGPPPATAAVELPPLFYGGPQVGFQPAAFAPPAAYAQPPQGPIPRTGFNHARLQAPPGPRQSTYPAPFVPIQPARPLLISEFLTVTAVNALKGASHKLLIDNATGSLTVQPDMSGLTTKKIKCPDILAWMKASERIKSVLIAMGAIQGPDYDSYTESCHTLMLDPTCGGHGWSLEVFLEFDNAHRLKQWTTGAAFDVICNLLMANFAAMAAAKTNKPAQTFLDSGTGSRRTGDAKGSRGTPRCYTWWNKGSCDKGPTCAFAKGHKCPCGSTRVHAPGSCPDKPSRAAATGDAAAPDHAG